MDIQRKAVYFRELHQRRPLILPTAWDAASARAMELAGASAIATTSAGVSWALGRGDGQTLQRDEMIQAVRRIVEAVTIPVTVDIEGGYGNGSVQDIAETTRAVIDAGAVGINLEDSPGVEGALLLEPDIHAERIRTARATAASMGIDLVINARTDVYLLAVGAPETRLDEAVRRTNLYHDAGADCLFVPGVIDVETIRQLVEAINGPVNIMAMPGAPTVPQLGELGVARVSFGPALMQAMLTTTQEMVSELLDRGTYQKLESSQSFATINGWFTAR
ncbi:MAG: isocitrate lyase/phosphoenolpyruvate mutase family protein [Chloroflexota bacterium]